MENIEKVEKGVEAILAKQAEFEAQVKAAQDRAEAAEAKAEAIAKAHQDGMSEVRALLEVRGTPEPEAKALMKGLSRFVNEAYLNKFHGLPMSADHVQKAVADFVTTTDATAGYLVPRMYNGVITMANEMYGALLPRCTTYVVPAGVTMPVNSRSTNPVATWDLQSVDMDETEFVYAQDTVSPKRLSAYIKASNEMLAAPNTGFTANVTDAFLRAIVKAKETALIVGSAGATTAPSDGILVHSSVSDQTNMASTLAALWTFIGESIIDNAELADPMNTLIMTTPAKYNTLVGLISGDAGTGVCSFVNGVFRAGGHEIIQHPANLISTTHWATMFSPRDLIVADSQDLSIDFNPYAGTGGATGGWVANETWIRVVTHMDWSLCGSLASKFSKADYS